MLAASNFFSSRRVLITGGNGFIGANLARRLVSLGSDTVLVVRDRANLWRIDEGSEQLTIVQSDISDSQQLSQLLAKHQPDCVFHLATPRGNNIDTWATMVQFNITMALNLTAALRHTPSTRLVVAGSAMEYGPSDHIHAEEDALHPTTWNGTSKAAAGMIYTTAAATFGLAINQLRLFHVYGPWESSHRLLPCAIRAAFSGKPLPLTENMARRDWVYIDDAVDALLQAASSDHQGEIFNIGSGSEASTEEVVRLVEKISGGDIQRINGAFPASPSDSRHRRGEISKAKSLLGWSPKFDLHHGISAMIEWCQQYPDAWQHETSGRPLHV